MVSTEEIRGTLASAFPGAVVHVEDTTGGGDHFAVRVTAREFSGKTLVEQHRMIYGALGSLMPRIHALQLSTAAA